MNFIPNDKEPVYLQIIKYFKQQIVIGKFKPGDIIPSRREMAVNIKVNPNTVQKAYKEMEDMEIIKTVRNHQSTITNDEILLSKLKEDLINQSLEVFIENMKAIKVEKEELIKIINEKY